MNGMLSLIRCFGDLEYKQNKALRQKDQILTAFPDIKIEKLYGDIDFLIIACDGVWNCTISQKAVDYFKPKIRPKEDKAFKISKLIEKMLDDISAKDVESSEGIGCDNMSCLVVRSNRYK
jgi:protein phosphatase 1G